MSSKDGKPILNSIGNQLISVIELSKEQPLPTYKAMVSLLYLSSIYSIEQLFEKVHYCYIENEFVSDPHCKCGSNTIGKSFNIDLDINSPLPLNDQYLLKLIFLSFVLYLTEKVTGDVSTKISVKFELNDLVETTKFLDIGLLNDIIDIGGMDILLEGIQAIVLELQEVINDLLDNEPQD